MPNLGQLSKINPEKLRYIERQIANIAPIPRLKELFGGTRLYLVGGATRDVIIGRKPKDFDFKIGLTTEEMSKVLEDSGFCRTNRIDLGPYEYYINDRTGTVSINVAGADVDLTFSLAGLGELIGKGDVNFSCCVYDAQSNSIKNPEIILDIDKRELRFCDPQEAIKDPIKVINALKQISRMPDIKLSDETLEIIRQSIPEIIRLIQENPDLSYKIASLCGNLNSEEVYSFFDSVDRGMEIFRGMPMKREKLQVSNP